MTRKFKLGQALATIGVVDLCRSGLDLGPYFDRHTAGDWGDVDEALRLQNESALENRGQLKSVYHPHGRRIWIVTDGERTRTVAMLPHEQDD